MKLHLLIIRLSLLLVAAVIWCSCARLLEEKSNMRLTTPATLEDNQALLDRIADVLGGFAMSGLASSDEYYITDASYNGLMFEEDRRLYTWQPDRVAISNTQGNDWTWTFKAILVTNTVLHNLEFYHIPDADNVRGQALALRAIRFLDAAQVWCVAYNPSTAAQDLGLPLRLDPDMNQPSVRANLKDTYAQIISDLETAVTLLPPKQVAVTRPSKATALAYLARTYLMMGDYPKALESALRVLQYQDTLMNFNTLNPNASYPIKNVNEEVLLRAIISTSGPVMYNIALVPPEIYNSYAQNDLRKTLFFSINADQTIAFRGNYTATSHSRLAGAAVDEIYLIIAECYARAGQTENSLQYLNSLLVTRWKTGTFVPLTASTSEEALEFIKVERKKELLFRGLRWTDLKRYNRDGAGIELTRTVLGKTYKLPPKDPRWALAIPEDIIEITGMPQNPR